MCGGVAVGSMLNFSLLFTERQQEKKGKGERAGEQELTRKLRGMEAQVQVLLLKHCIWH